jgi:hypothetical protein
MEKTIVLTMPLHWSIAHFVGNGMFKVALLDSSWGPRHPQCHGRSKFQIPMGILQHSEFCWKFLPVRPEPCSDVSFLP